MGTLHDLEILYIPGEYYYGQKINGKKNYLHTCRNLHYNGCGGKQTFIGSKLLLYGVDENNQEVQIPIKNEILQTFNRNKITEFFASKVESALPKEVTICKNDDGRYCLSKDSCRIIYRKIHARKKLYI
ncbi:MULTISPECIES: hypothetical protein [Clostridium]|uniref:Uncharacterized protein n=1 Tax=Clostridium frigoriphilum TaxID=443253 RepID=A0ABU7UR78_9CLOT|nr:hypothetical protein [Clostridium sp. DSM 17811]MBU3100700.1 hypothetical protein [Clostridium sp. DSM 17811]